MNDENDKIRKSGRLKSQKGENRGRSKSVPEMNTSTVTMEGNSSNKSLPTAWDCGTCKEFMVAEDVMMIECDFCLAKHCISCIGMSENEYSARQDLASKIR